MSSSLSREFSPECWVAVCLVGAGVMFWLASVGGLARV